MIINCDWNKNVRILNVGSNHTVPKNLEHLMIRKYQTSKLLFTKMFSLVLLGGFFFEQFYPNWSLRTASLISSYRISSFFSFFGLIYCLTLLFRPASWLKSSMIVVFSLLFGMLSCSEIFPFDTTTHPVDIQTLKTFDSGKKLVVRKYENAKTGWIIQDTVLVKDVFIFRRIYKG
jgi:hypothetical protein